MLIGASILSGRFPGFHREWSIETYIFQWQESGHFLNQTFRYRSNLVLGVLCSMARSSAWTTPGRPTSKIFRLNCNLRWLLSR